MKHEATGQRARIQRVEERIVRLPKLDSFGAIGDPGCEGLGTYNMNVYAGALEACAADDVTLILGDLVPIGTRHYYDTVCTMTEELAGNDVFVLRGNHDTGEYARNFGLQNYAILAGRLAIIVIDNAMRRFEDEGLALASEVLAMDEVELAVLAFHIPVPNRFVGNSVSGEEFARLQAAYRPWQGKLKAMLCGHVHSCFVDEVDGVPLICTGGGGAMIEDVSDEIRASDVDHHVVHFRLEGDELRYQFEVLPENVYDRERSDEVLCKQLRATVQDEMMAHLKYLTFADRAKRRGMDALANLFQALAESEYVHARNFYALLERPAPFADAPAGYIPGEKFEYEMLYRMLEEYARRGEHPLSEQAYRGAAEAEKVHARLLTSASDVDGFDVQEVYVCPICGYVMTGDALPERCPVCGGPKRQFLKYSAQQQ